LKSIARPGATMLLCMSDDLFPISDPFAVGFVAGRLDLAPFLT
jgi:hypothetical protein